MSKIVTAYKGVALGIGIVLTYWLGRQAFFVGNYALLVYAIAQLMTFILLSPFTLTWGESLFIGAAFYVAISCSIRAVKEIWRTTKCL